MRRSVSRLETVGETLRAALNAVALVETYWLRASVPLDWFDRYAHRADDYRFPKGKDARRTYGEQIGQDGASFLALIDDEMVSEHLKALPAVLTLRTVWTQQYIHEGERLRWKKREELDRAGGRIDTPYDADVRYGNKRSTAWSGYKVHLTETCDEDTPHLITDVTTTLATVPDVLETAPIEAALAQRGLRNMLAVLGLRELFPKEYASADCGKHVIWGQRKSISNIF